MPDATLAFSLITFNDIKAASLSNAIIPRSVLHNRILLVKTSSGNYAKILVQSGPNLNVFQLTVYNAAGCIIKTAGSFNVNASFFCDIDTGTQVGNVASADFWWHALSSSDSQLEPKNGATFALFKDFDATTFAEVSTAPYVNKKVSGDWLGNQIVFCKTNAGRYAKLRVELEPDNDLKVSRMVVYNANGTQFLSLSNISIPKTYVLDVDTGAVGATGDLWWENVDSTTRRLSPFGGATISFDSYFKYEKYITLLNTAAIKTSLVISGASNRNYNSWTEIEKLQLREFNWLLETGGPLPITGPPALISGRYMSNCDAVKIYMAHVAQSLWVDATVTWKLSAATASHLAHLFDMTKLFKFTAGSGYSFEGGVMGNVTHWSPGISYNFLKDNSFIKANKWDTIKALVEWVRANCIHISGYASDTAGGPFASQEDQWEYIYGYRYLPPVDKMITPLPGRNHITHGCWGTDGFLAAVLRTVNIPVKHGRSNFSGASHSRAEFFTEAKNLRHGDDPYNGWVRLGHNNVPIDRIFLTDAEIASLIDSPAPLPGKTVPETASFNHSKIYIQLAVEFKTNYLLDMRCADINSGISTGAGSQVWQNLHDYYTDAQIATIVANCNTAIAAIPGGCSAI